LVSKELLVVNVIMRDIREDTVLTSAVTKTFDSLLGCGVIVNCPDYTKSVFRPISILTVLGEVSIKQVALKLIRVMVSPGFILAAVVMLK
jgi:hypothetical protein